MSAFRITAPSTEPRFKVKAQKPKKVSAADKRPGMSEQHLALVRKLPCVCCGREPGGEAHHIKIASERGMGLRATDKWAIPLCNEHHINGVERVGSRNELSWFSKQGIDAMTIACALWMNTGEINRMRGVIAAHWEKKS